LFGGVASEDVVDLGVVVDDLLVVVCGGEASEEDGGVGVVFLGDGCEV